MPKPSKETPPIRVSRDTFRDVKRLRDAMRAKLKCRVTYGDAVGAGVRKLLETMDESADQKGD